jgi:lysophospholipase L1-like esterase
MESQTTAEKFEFDYYIALGDSMSIDLYPSTDAKNIDGCHNDNLGAASLLLVNDDFLFPEFKGKDLSTLNNRLSFANLAFDGATTSDLLQELDALRQFSEKRCFVTLTVGGNDLLACLRLKAVYGSVPVSEVESIFDRLVQIVRAIETILPQSHLIINSIYDPTDGTGRFTESNLFDGQLPVELLVYLNYLIEKFAQNSAQNSAGTKEGGLSISFCNIYKHFLGHGMSSSDGSFWYWRPHPIEPGYLGASEIRRLWWQVVQALA